MFLFCFFFFFQVSISNAFFIQISASVEEVLPVFNPPQHSDDVGIRVRRNTPLPAGGPLGRYPPYKPTGADLEAAKALEKQLEEVRKQEQALLRQGDAVLNALALNTQILIGFSATVKSIYPDNYHPGTSSCGKVVLTDSSISSVSFVLGYVLALVLAVHKLRKLARLAKHLKTRRKNVQRDSLDFLKDFMAQGIHPAPSSTSSMPNSPYDIAVARARADVDANTQSLESSFGKRIRSMIEDPSTVSKFGSDYTWGLIVFTFLAAVYGLGYPLISAHLRCRENV